MSDCVGKTFSLFSDKRKAVGILRYQSPFGTSTLEIVRGAFEISEDTTEGVYCVEFSSDKRFIVFGRLDKWFSVEQECVVDLPIFSGNSPIYDEGYPLKDGSSNYFCVVAYDIPGFGYFPCPSQISSQPLEKRLILNLFRQSFLSRDAYDRALVRDVINGRSNLRHRDNLHPSGRRHSTPRV